MRTVRIVCLAVGFVDFVMAALLLTKPGAVIANAGADPKSMMLVGWLSASAFASAAVLVFAAVDPSRFLPVMIVDAAARAFGTLASVRYAFEFFLLFACEGALAIVLAGAIAFEVRRRRVERRVVMIQGAPGPVKR